MVYPKPTKATKHVKATRATDTKNNRKPKRKAAKTSHKAVNRRIASVQPHIMLPSPTYCHQTPPQPGNAPSPPLNPPMSQLAK